ncbi:von Willebrand factor D and EGF domain-containing protein-like [Ruditapes philippinarum]|uniref:von Willebrand factor D and EGF domain-containing protein-like n=1 Tax=Ruditapes philippinarum TaxID=129788 RepID=UPI00295BFFAB|nr:von Willebrand factor D and EGF domain-containing protein-like [Ruditapes philippinarum]
MILARKRIIIEKHVDIADIGENVITAEVCIWNHTDECISNFTVEMRTCNGHLLYRFLWDYDHYYDFDHDYNFYYNTFVCFACQSSEFVYSAGNVTDRFLNLSYPSVQFGWLDAHQNGKQYVLPAFDDVNEVFEECIERIFLDIPENIPVKYAVCYVYKRNLDYDYYDNYIDLEYKYENYCTRYVYARKCDGKIQFDVSFFPFYGHLCLIHYNNVKVIPEINHREDIVSDDTIIYRPYIQFRCSFVITGDTAYKVTWYINGTLWSETGFSSNPDDLVLSGDSLNKLRLGYEVKCGVIAAGTTDEKLSNNFFAGWKISDTSRRLPKNGYAIVEVEQTVPLGCTYINTGEEVCEETLSISDVNREIDACKAGIHVMNADNNSTSSHKIKSLMVGDVWNSSIKYRFRLTTIDHDYDDKLNFDMELLVTKSELTEVVNTERIRIIAVEVTHSAIHRYKRCYSHADPHVRTADGRYFGQQLVGDHMFYRNKAYQTEVHEYARYCNNNGGAVCACGVAIRSGADVFVINRCGNYTILDFLQCNDGGIIDVQRIHDYRYKVITPIGTVIIVNLHSWGRTMDIDIYLSAKDFHNTDGLCGYFDGDRNNDFRHRNGSQSSTSHDYYGYTDFIKSWRLLDEENFLHNESRVLEKWNVNNGASMDEACSNGNSISKNKCQFGGEKRKRRDVVTRIGKEIKSNINNMREKRSTGGDISDDKAREKCNNSITGAPSVKEFSDQLGDEDTNIVFDQCVYDIIHGNSTVWASAHVDALNSIASTVISLSPDFAANNSETVKAFLSQTCTNNCSGHGVCSDSGLCSCEDVFRGPDCSIDLRIPPIIYDINDGGLCDTADGNECDCFVIRTDNIFDGFKYEITTFEMLFDGTKTQVGKSTNVGKYEDIFTGECCVPHQRSKRSTEDSQPSVLVFDFVISNDGENFGQSKSVYVYDSTCLNYVITDDGEIVVINLEENFCYIGGSCITGDSTLQTSSDCFVCDSQTNPYSWTKVSCNDDDIGLSSAALIGIIVGSVLVGIIATVAVVYVRCYKVTKNRRTVGDMNSSQTYLSAGPARETWGDKH